MTRWPIVVPAALAVLAGCGGGSPSASGDLRSAQQQLAKATSGKVSLELRASGGPGSPTATYGLVGRFAAAAHDGAPPVLDLQVTRQVGSATAATTELRSTGSQVFARPAGGRWSVVQGQQAAGLTQLGTGSPVAGVHLASWAKAPRRTGADVVGQLDPAALLADLAPALGAAAPSPADADRLRRSVTASSFLAHLGAGRLPAHVHAEVTFGLPGQEALARSLGPVGASTFAVDLQLSDVGSQVVVVPPA